MVSIPTVLAAIPGAAVIAVTVLSQAYFWQRKEYRLDRMRSLLTSAERQGAVSPWLFAGCILLVFGWVSFFTGSFLASFWGWGAVLAFAVHHTVRVRTRGLFRPTFTPKAILVIAGACIFLAVILATYNPAALVSLQWASFIVLTPPALAAAVAVVNGATYPRRQAVINQAKLLRRQLKGLTVIGITGSYGKTSTKSFLNQILTSAHVPHAASAYHRNSELAIAQDMLAQLSSKTDIYIAEMGAYAAGEIAALARLARPRVGIITSIGNQHLSLFGSQEKLAQAKWELADSLPSDGTLVLNADDPVLQAKSKSYPGQIVWFGTSQPAQVSAADVKVHPRRLDFTLNINGQSRNIAVPLLSRAPLPNILAAAAAAFVLGVPPARIFDALVHLKPMPRTMELRPSPGKRTVIDDSYSANEAGVLEAIRHLGTFPDQHKYVFLTPLIELGPRAPTAHQRIGQALKSSGATVFVTNPQNAADLKQGFGPDPDAKLKIVPTPAQLAASVRQVPRQSVILLEGRVPDLVRSRLLG